MFIKEATITDVPSNTRLIISENYYCVVLNGTVIVKGSQTKHMCERSIFKAKGILYSGHDGCKIIAFGEDKLPEQIRQKVALSSKMKTQTEKNSNNNIQLGHNKLLYEKNFTCPVCGVSFASHQVRLSKLRSVKQDPDLRMHYKEVNPVLYNIIKCPECSYANLAQDFEEVVTLKEPLSFINEDKNLDHEQVTEIELAVEKHKIALQCLEMLNSTPNKLARICLYLAWLYDDDGRETLAKEMRQNALTYYKQAYSTSSDMDSSQVHQITYLIAELSSQLGNKKDAYDFFQRLIRDKDAAPWLVKLARERLYELRKSVQMV